MAALVKLAATLVALVMLGSAAVQAEAVTAEDQAAFKAVITAQIEALRKDDFAAAYAVAAPSMKALYPTVQAFMQVIRGRYAPLIRPRTVVFGTVTQTSQGPVQRVFLTASDGRAYVASYSLQQQPDKTWLIAGYTVARDNGSSAI